MNGKRIAGLVAMIVSALLGALLLVGIIGTWVAAPRLTSGVSAAFLTADRLLSFVNDQLNRVDQRLEQIEVRTGTVQEKVTRLGDKVEENSVVLALVQATVGDELAPSVERIRETVSAVRTILETANQTIETINALPFVYVQPPGSELIAQLVAAADALESAVQELRANVAQARAETIGGAVDTILSPIQRIDQAAGEARTVVANVEARVSTSQQRFAAAREQALFLINLGAWGVTIVLLLLGVGQAALFLVGYSVYSGKDVFAQWRGNP